MIFALLRAKIGKEAETVIIYNTKQINSSDCEWSATECIG